MPFSSSVLTRFVPNLPASGEPASITLTLDQGDGEIGVNAWSFRQPHPQSQLLTAGVPVALGTLPPPGVIYVEGQLTEDSQGQVQVTVGSQVVGAPIQGQDGQRLVITFYLIDGNPPATGDAIFADGFEGGTTGRWSQGP